MTEVAVALALGWWFFWFCLFSFGLVFFVPVHRISKKIKTQNDWLILILVVIS